MNHRYGRHGRHGRHDRPWAALFLMAALLPAPAWAGTYELDIAREMVNVTGAPLEKITVNGGIPGPTLHWTDGEDVTIVVRNHMEDATSIHWHGLLLPGGMDGVPGFNNFPGIPAGGTFTYRFPIRQTGTYWYHAHSRGQEQEGEYGAIVIAPRGGEAVRTDRDYVVLLSDYHDDDSSVIMRNLKLDDDFYQYDSLMTVGRFLDYAKGRGFGEIWRDMTMWGRMRMGPTDLTDVTGYVFLMNGRVPERNWTGLFKAGERVRLRFINAAAMSFFDVRIPGLTMEMASADGQDVEPVEVDEFRFGVAETYDVIVTPPDDKAYTIVAESIDRRGFAAGTLAPREGMTGPAPVPRPRALLTMGDMPAMAHDGPDEAREPSGWDDAGAPPGSRRLDYADLRSRGTQPDARPAGRDVEVRLSGNMEHFVWMMNGKRFAEAEPVALRYGERVRLTFVNDTMMAHPMHLHGMFVQLDNGQPAEKLPNKHVVIVKPGQTYSALLTANESGEWAFHCHLLYHMMAGMMRKVVVATVKADDVPSNSRHDAQGRETTSYSFNALRVP